MKNGTYIVSGDDTQVVTLTEQQQVHLKGINEEDIQSAVMDGEDLVVTLHDGRVITIENFGVYDFDTTLEIVDDAGAIVPFPIILSSLAGIVGLAALSGGGSEDTTAAAPTPDAPTVALNADTGASATDGRTNDGTVNVTLAADAASWEHSTDGGATWTAGTGTSFELAEGIYADGDVQVRQTDAAGNTSAATNLAGAVTVDMTVAAPAVALNADTGASATDGVTNDGTVNVTLAADAASWEFSTDGGATWTAGTGTSFELAEGVYADGTVQVRQTDAAGNTSAAADLAGAVTVDVTVAAPAVALNADTGASATDGRTNDGTVNVTLAADAVSWEFSSDGGATWVEIAVVTNGEVSFTLAEGTYADGDVQVRQTDAAGNTSAAANLAGAVTVVDLVQATAVVAGPGLAAAMGDVNNDGNIDLVVGEPGLGGFYTYYEGIGDGTLAPKTVVGDPQSQPNAVILADFNGDGNLDLLTADGLSGNRIELQLGNGDGTFDIATLLATVGGGVAALEAGDVDGDGNLDFVATSPNGDSVELFYGNGDGTFDPAVEIDMAFDVVRDSTLGDFDGDGDVDILATGGGSLSQGGSQVVYYENNGDGTFAAGSTILDGFAVGNAVVAGDFNGDGNLDFVLANKGSGAGNDGNGLSVLLGNGDGTFGAQSVIQEGWNVLNIEVADFDGDGVLDIAGATPNADGGLANFALWLGNGDGSFQDPLTIAETRGAYALAVGDLNNDGKLDITGVDRFSETFDVYVLEVV